MPIHIMVSSIIISNNFLLGLGSVVGVRAFRFQQCYVE